MRRRRARNIVLPYAIEQVLSGQPVENIPANRVVLAEVVYFRNYDAVLTAEEIQLAQSELSRLISARRSELEAEHARRNAN